MKKLVLLAGLLLPAVVLAVAPPQPAEPSWARPLLAHAKLEPRRAQLDPNRWTGGGTYRLNTFQRLWDDWRQVDGTAYTLARRFLAAGGRFEDLLTCAMPLLDVAPPGDKAAKEVADDTLVRALADLHRHLGKPLSAREQKELEDRAKDVPAEVGRAAAVVLRAVPDALARRNAALAKFGDAKTHQTAYERARSLALGYRVDADTLKLMRTVDLKALLHGGQVLARAVDRAVALLDRAPEGRFSFSWDTPLGAVVLNGSQNDTYEARPYLLIIDTGGNDQYRGGAATLSAAQPISVLLDRAGNDRYETAGDRAFGVGILGYAFLHDGGGNDTYRARHLGCGVGAFGVGMLVDRDGKDRYEIDRVGQGAAAFGVGVLCDLKGNDEYHCFEQAQGYGAVRGCGVLVDHEGDDRYEANDTNIRYPSPQDNRHNTSLAQGCAFGRRAHPGDGNSLAGGVGLLIDGKGDDRYRCGVFGQGVSYWYGLGMLVDLGGNDSYDGVWYCQGSAAHYGVGALCDLAGNDRYLGRLTMAQGAGHDYSIAWLHDSAGNDVYECPGGSMGFAYYNSVGVLWDEGGDDTYKGPAANAFGYAGESRPGSLSLGLFIDEGGKNVFPKNGPAKQGKVWQQAVKGQPLHLGLGMSR